MIARAARVVAGIQKSKDALALVVVHAHNPHKSRQGGHRQQAGFEHVAPQPVEQNHAPQNKQNKQGGAQVGLTDDQGAGHQPYAEHGAKVLPTQGATVAGQQARAQHQHGELGHL